MEETFTGTVKWHYYSKSYVIDMGKSPRNIQLSDLLKKFKIFNDFFSPETDEKLEHLILKFKQGKIPVGHQEIVQLKL